MIMFYFIYETTNLINGSKYRGFHQTFDVNNSYLESGPIIIKAIKKYGKRNFKREILEFCDSFEHLIEREAFYVNIEWINRKDTYNLKTGGWGGSKHSEELKSKHWSRTNKLEVSQKIREANTNHITSEKTRKKLSDAGIGKIQSIDHINKRIAYLIKPVLQLDINGNLIEEFVSMAEASNKTKINKANIMSVCKRHRPKAGGYIWEYKI